jgi:hypothetical protein
LGLIKDMAWYQCRIRGEHFPGELLEESGLVGFYTTRVVEADSPEEAETKALANLKDERELQIAPTHRTQDARVFFEDISELKRRPVRKPGGFTFFKE